MATKKKTKSKVNVPELGQDLADRIMDGLRRAMALIPPPPKSDAVKELCAEADVDWRFLNVHSYKGFGWSYHDNIAWGLQHTYSVSIDLEYNHGRLWIDAIVKLNWGTCGELTPEEAVATASRYLTAAHTAAQATMVLRDALERGNRHFRGLSNDDLTAVWKEAESVLRQRREVNERLLEEARERLDGPKAPE